MTAVLQHANYPGDQTAMVGKVVGPNTMGELLIATAAEYDAAADKTRVSFRYATVDEITEATR